MLWCLLDFIHLLCGRYDAHESDLWLAWLLVGGFYAAFNQVISLRCVCVKWCIFCISSEESLVLLLQCSLTPGVLCRQAPACAVGSTAGLCRGGPVWLSRDLVSGPSPGDGLLFNVVSAIHFKSRIDSSSKRVLSSVSRVFK